jgi:hypothetical protein
MKENWCKQENKNTVHYKNYYHVQTTMFSTPPQSPKKPVCPPAPRKKYPTTVDNIDKRTTVGGTFQGINSASRRIF